MNWELGRYYKSPMISRLLDDRSTLIYFLLLVFILVLGIFGPYLAPYEFDRSFYTEDDSIDSYHPPSLDHPLGTNGLGQDILSRILYGARPTVITGLLGGVIIAGVGLSVGLITGYKGGRTDSVLMRFTDMMYSIPAIPFAMVILAFVGVGLIESIVVIGLILWRGSARVIRSQVLQIKQEPYILSLQTNGASTYRIIVKHILPNVAPMGILFFALGIGSSILIQASLAFLGYSNPFLPSWGVMVRNAFNSGHLASAWWWSIPPGLLIAISVLATFMFGRNYELLIGGEGTAMAGRSSSTHE